MYYSYDLRSDSTVLTQSQGADGNTYYGEGTWSLTGSAFKATITSTSESNRGIVQTTTAVYSGNEGTLTGIWQNQTGDAAGTFTLKRIN